MNLPTPLNTRRRMTALAVAALAGVGVANAQYTGIGTTKPSASLHVSDASSPLDTSLVTGEILKVEKIKRTGAYEVTYASVMVYDPTTGIVRHRELADLFDDNTEWVLAGGILSPRNLNANTVDIQNAGVAIGVATTINSTLNATGATTLGSTLTVGDATTLNNTLSVAGNSTLGGTLTVNGAADAVTISNVTTETATATNNFDRIMIQDALGVVRNIDVADLLDEKGEWVFDAGTSTLSPRRFGTGVVDVTAGSVGIGQPTSIASTLGVTGATTLASTLAVTGAATLSSTLGVTGATTIGGTTTLGTVANHPTPIGTDKVLVQQDGSDLVEHVTVIDLLAANSEFYFNTLTSRSESRRFADVITFDADDVAISQNTALAANLNVTGATALASTLGVTGATTLADALTVTNATDAVTLGSLTQVTDVNTDLANNSPATGAPFERVLISDATGIVRYIDADDLVSSAAEWVYDALNTRIYARRAQASGADVWVTDAGNHVVETTASYQFGDATNRVKVDGIDATGAYTVTNGGATDVTFQEAGSAAPWLFHDSDAGGFGEIGRVGINTNTPQATLHVAGNIVASNTAVTSDRRFKRDIEELHGALRAVNALRGVSYEFRDDEFPTENFDDATHLGFIAQEVREILPQAVFERADGYLTVDYSAVTPVLVEAVQELTAKVAALESENAALKGGTASTADVSTKRLRDLEARLAAMDARLQAVAAGRK